MSQFQHKAPEFNHDSVISFSKLLDSEGTPPKFEQLPFDHPLYIMKLFYDDIPENTDIVQGIIENNTKGLIVTAREADWGKLPEDFQKKFKRLSHNIYYVKI